MASDESSFEADTAVVAPTPDDARFSRESATASPAAVAAHSDDVTPWRVPRWLVLGLLAYTLAYVLWRAFPTGAPRTRELVDQLALTLPGFVTIACVWGAARRCAGEPRTASAWRWMTASFSCLTLGFAVKLGYEATTGSTPFPSIADAIYLCFYAFFLIGLLRFPTRPQADAGARRVAIDVAVVVLAATSVIWFLVLGATLTAGGQSLLSAIVSGAYPVGDLIQIFGLTYVGMRALAPATRRPLRYLGVGIAIAIASDVWFSWAVLHGHPSGVVLTEIGWMSAWLFYSIAGASQRPVSASDVSEGLAGAAKRGVSANRARVLPYVAPAVVLCLLLASQFGAPRYQRVGLALGAAAVAALVLLRQFLAQRDLLAAQGQLSHRALHDPLTELPNRSLVLDRAEQLLARARREQRPVAALYVDVDGFKQVNDSFGHAAGDALLRAVAARLDGLVRASDTVGRMGGDEFVVLLDSLTLDVAPELVAERLLDVLRQPLEIAECEGRPVRVTASVGIATAQHGTAEELLRNADLALYRAKAAGKDRAVVFESSMQTIAESRLLLAMDLREALDRREMFLVYQPTFDLQTKVATGVEALLRWRHPTRGVLGPDVFMAIAEETGLIVPIGGWVLEEACCQAAQWHADGLDVRIAVNVSARQLEHDIEAQVSDVLEASGLNPESLTLEITETALMRDPAVAATRLRALKALGVSIAIDDFGTGYSSLAYLRQFPVDALKIDRSFISGLAASREPTALVHTLIQLGKTLDIETLGEGIEEPDQLLALQREQCDSGQGFLLAHPLEAAEVASFLASSHAAAERASQGGADAAAARD